MSSGLDLWRTAGLILALSVLACREGAPPPSTTEPSKPEGKAAPFEDITSQTGLDFHHFNGMTGAFYFVEIIGPGGALFDYDRDGDLDLFLVQSHLLGEGKTPSDAIFPPSGDGFPKDRLFRNDLTIGSDGSRSIRFVDVTEESGIESRGYGMGAAVGDIDNDGYPDLYITNFGRNLLYKNNGNGTFTDITSEGVDDERFSVSAAFTDIDQDGDLDLFIGNYADYAIETDTSCFARFPDYCHPTTYPAVTDRLLINESGTFTDVSEQAGITAHSGRALGVTATDFDGDGLVDLYVANDATANHLWLNQGNLRFKENAMLAGCALNEMGKAEASMGVDAADFDGDGDEDLFMTHNRKETNTIYVNDGGVFTDQSVATGLAAPSLAYTGFGAGFFDFDRDGLLDIFVANGAVVSLADIHGPNDPYPYHEPNLLFRNLGDGRMDQVDGGPAFEASNVSRGALFGDLDNDGAVDIVVVNNSGPARVLRNTDQSNQWLGLEFRDGPAGRHLLGARVRVELEDGSSLFRRVRNDGSYAGSRDPRLVVGLGSYSGPVRVRVTWPGGKQEAWSLNSINQYHLLTPGSGETVIVEGVSQ